MDKKQGMQPATKDDIDGAVDKLAVVIGNGFLDHDKRFDAIEVRLDRIEHLLLEEQRRDIEELKKRMKRVEDIIAV